MSIYRTLGRVLAALTVISALLVLPVAQASAEKSDSPHVSRGWDGGFLYQGEDVAYFDFDEGRLNVCDNEKDGDAVYAYFRYRNDMVSMELYDNTSGCTWYSIEGKSAYKYVTICEEAWGPDWCHSPVYLR